MIRNVCIHVTNEQPLLADLFALPSATDAGLLCANLRMMDGKRPIFIDRIEDTFFFPYHVIRFIEIPAGALEAHEPAPADPGFNGAQPQVDPDHPTSDERFLPVPVVAGAMGGSDEDGDIEIDEGFLQRIRDI